jgi:serine/threonine protein kinase
MNEREIFAAALEKDTPADRSDFLTAACGEDRALRERIESLLAEHDTLGSFLETPPMQLREAIRDLEAQDSFGLSARNLRTNDEFAREFLAPSDMPGHLGRFGPYEVSEIIGQGGMGIVLKALDPSLHRSVAIKILAPPLAANAGARKRFVREARAAAAISHEHVVTIHAVDEWLPPNIPSGTLPYLVMQLVCGESLQERIDRTGPLELREVLRIGMQAAAGLAAAHAQGLIHRDVKPANILLENGVERVKITDFGLARAVDDASITQEGVVAGTPQYMSPEQARCEPIDPRSDLFSLGGVLYAMCTGHPPFRATTTVGVLRSVCDDVPRPIKESNADIPDWFDTIIDKLLAKNPDERFQSATEIAQLLSNCLAHVQQPSAVPLPNILGMAASGTIKPPRFRRGLTAAAVISLIAASIGFSEATGVTQFVPMMIRVVTGEGTLIVQVDDPDVSVLIDGEEISIKGAGTHGRASTNSRPRKMTNWYVISWSR